MLSLFGHCPGEELADVRRWSAGCFRALVEVIQQQSFWIESVDEPSLEDGVKLCVHMAGPFLAAAKAVLAINDQAFEKALRSIVL